MTPFRRAIVAALLAALALPAPAAGAGTRHLAGAEQARSLDAQINAHRRAAGLRPVARSARADSAARRHAADMARNGFFAHRGSDRSTHSQRLGAAGCRGGAENIAAGSFTAAGVVAAWMGSPGHRRNILRPAVRVYGLANVADRWVMVLSAGC